MHKLHTNFIVSLSILFLFFNLTLASQPEGIKITKTANGYRVDFTLSQYRLESTVVEREEFISLTNLDYGVSPEVGVPALPLVSFNLFISYDERQPTFRINEMESEEIGLQSKIFPFQMPWEKSNSLSERPFTINRDYYNSAGKVNQPIVDISEPFVIGGVKGVMVTIFPFRYNPVEDQLTIINTLSFEINLENPGIPILKKSESTNNFFENVFVNYDGINGGADIKYLIITAPQFESDMSSFVNHKNSNGFDVDIFSTNTTDNSATSIRNFIQQRYDNIETRPEYLLLVGDIGSLPAWNGSGTGSPTTDLKYAQLDGNDYFPDVFVGRFSVSSPEELQNAIEKSIYMESYIGTLQKKNIFMASTDNWQISEGTHNYVIDNFFDPSAYTSQKLYTHTYGATTQQLIDALNSNQIFAVYSGHGGEYSWDDGPQLNQQQVRNFTNTWYPFVFSFACVTGSYQANECFGETWLRTEAGASTFYGASADSFWDEDDILEKKVFYAMLEDDKTRVTPMFLQGMIYFVNHFGGVNGTTLRYMEMYNLMGDPSMPVMQQIPPDITPPDPITDLTAVNPTSNSITLNWTAPYDSTPGGIAVYDIRYSTSMISNDNEFNNAPQKLFTGQSDSAGTFKTYTIDQLEFNTTYYFAIKAMDIWGNASEISNVPFSATYFAPELTLNHDSLHLVVLQNSTHTDSIVISNTSEQNSTLDYTITLTNNTFPDNTLIRLVGLNELIRATNSGSKEYPIDRRGFSFKGAGGPDSFGYEWKDSNEPDGPVYEWNNITSDLNSVLINNWEGNKDDGYTSPIPIGFEFGFYSYAYTNLFVSTNGFISFTGLSSSYFTNEPIPTDELPNNIICPIWDDMDGRFQGTVHYLQETDKFTIQFTNWQRYSGSGSYTFQIVLKSNNRIYFYYKNLVGNLTSATVGIENHNGTDGLQMTHNSAYLENEFAVVIYAEPEWVALDHFAGTLYNGTSIAVTLNIITEDLDMGDYSMDMVFTTNDPNNSEVIVPITMTVTNEIPVELSFFTAEYFACDVNLKWQTSSETNNRGFEIEKAPLNPPEGGTSKEWEKIGFIEGKGTSTEKSDYIYKDIVKKPGTYIYRLRQIDFDGAESYSQEIEVEVTGPGKFALYQNYPNPFNPTTTIKFDLPVKTNLVLSVYNSVGEKVREIYNGELESGYHEVEFNALSLSSGVYYYRIQSKQFVDVKKMIVVK